ncbi:response regulator transcription factor [Kallipyga massiliensis]|uniref:response regulator transcription factor n=1 Tax=Kallipyga massiliensis TaxID=1472764 RepID=UPI0004BBECF0|nr:response regulator transcription factor [Kallipyga massiliensis]
MPMIYLVEDDQNIRDLICYALRGDGFRASGFEDANSLYRAMEKELPDLFILDIMLEGESGYDILKKLKANAKTRPLPVLMLTAKTAEYDKVKGLDMGADDYVTKPFGVMELLSRIRAILRRYGVSESHPALRLGSLSLDPDKRSVEYDGKPVELTYKEFELLHYLMDNLELVLSRDQIMEEVWGYEYAGETRTVDVHIRSLRHKLGDGARYIHTVRNVGYKMEA